MAASKITIKKVCEWCGQEFYAEKLTTRFCCKRCNEHAYKAKLRRSQVSLVEKELLEEENTKVQEHFDGKLFLTVIETAALLGLTRMTVYNRQLMSLYGCLVPHLGADGVPGRVDTKDKHSYLNRSSKGTTKEKNADGLRPRKRSNKSNWHTWTELPGTFQNKRLFSLRLESVDNIEDLVHSGI